MPLNSTHKLVSRYSIIVPSYTNPGKQYDIDLDLYLCSCPAFPRIRFCKHMDPVQTFFSISGSSVELFDSTAPALEEPPPSPSFLSQPVDKSNSKVALSFSLTNLNTALDECLDISGPISKARVLPASQKVAPNLRTWNETKKVMPAAKTARKRIGDQAYGAGAASGKKAKESPRCVIAGPR